MRYEKMPRAEVSEADPSTMRNAINVLLKAGADVRRPASPYQLKLTADLSFYPTKGTIMKDGDSAPLPQRGLNQLIALLRENGDIPPAGPDRTVEL